MRKKNQDLREQLLSAAREISFTEGPSELNIRSLAKKVGVATGTVYNYFSDKEEILLVLTEEYWKDVLQRMQTQITQQDFLDKIQEIYFFLLKEMNDYGRTLMGALAQSHKDGQFKMQRMQQVLQQKTLLLLESDSSIPKTIWNDKLTAEEFSKFLVGNVNQMLRTNTTNIDSFMEIVKRVLYEKGDEENASDSGNSF